MSNSSDLHTLYLSIQGEEIAVRTIQANTTKLKQAADIVDAKIADLHASNATIPSHKLAIMIALQLCFEGLEKKEAIQHLEQEFAALKTDINELQELLKTTESSHSSIASEALQPAEGDSHQAEHTNQQQSFQQHQQQTDAENTHDEQPSQPSKKQYY